MSMTQPQPARARPGTNSAVTHVAIRSPEFISVPEWSRRVGCSADSAYRAAPTGGDPGVVPDRPAGADNWDAFVGATAADPA